MAFTSRKEVYIEVVPNGCVQIRTETIFSENGVDVSRALHRRTLTPGEGLADQPEDVKRIAKAAWTPAVVEAFKTQQTAQQATASRTFRAQTPSASKSKSKK